MDKSMKLIGIGTGVLLAALAASGPLAGQPPNPSYPRMEAVSRYLMQPNAEIALARTGGPADIANAADVMVLGTHGYTTAVHGTNGFVCMVLRGWNANLEDPDFWNPKSHGPACFNPAAVSSYLPFILQRAEMAVAGRTKQQMAAAISAAIAGHKVPAMAPGAMCFMLSKQQYLGDGNGNWHPHLMFFVPSTDAVAWGASVPNSPIIATPDTVDQLTVFVVPVRAWSDGTPDIPAQHP